MEQFEQPLRRPEKLLNAIVLPDESVTEIYGDPATQKAEYFFRTDSDGTILEYVDLRDREGMRELTKKYFEDHGVTLTEEELNNLTLVFIQKRMMQHINAIDENTATEQ